MIKEFKEFILTIPDLYRSSVIWLTLCTLNVVDLLSTKVALAHGAVEANPIMSVLITHGWLYVVLFKVVACLACLVLVVKNRANVLETLTLVYALVVLRTIINLTMLG